jgi:hypothetical protein
VMLLVVLSSELLFSGAEDCLLGTSLCIGQAVDVTGWECRGADVCSKGSLGGSAQACRVDGKWTVVNTMRSGEVGPGFLQAYASMAEDDAWTVRVNEDRKVLIESADRRVQAHLISVGSEPPRGMVITDMLPLSCDVTVAPFDGL